MAKHRVNAGDLEKAALAVVLLHDGSSGSGKDQGFALGALKAAVLGPGSGPIVPEHMEPDPKEVSDELDRLIARAEGDAEVRLTVEERQDAATEARHATKSPSKAKKTKPKETHAAVSEVDVSKTPVAAPVRSGAQSTKPKAQKPSK